MVKLSDTYYEFGPFQLDLREHLLLRSGQPVAVNPKTFSVLVALVTRGGNLVTKEELFAEVWPDANVEDSNLSQKVYQLRKLLSDGSDGEEYIQNVPRVGYRFVAPVHIVQPRSSGEAQEATAVNANDLTRSISRPKRWVVAVVLGLLLIVGCWAWRYLRSTEPQRQLLSKRETRNVDAYQAYVTGLYFSQSFSDAGTIKAIKYFQQAIETDSSYAKAYAALARCYARAVNNFEDIAAPEDAMRLSAEAAKRALELDPNLADAHVSLGDTFYLNDQLDEADREYQFALQLEPNSSMFQMKYGMISFASLKLDRAVLHLKLAQELDPVSPVINSSLGLMLIMQRDYENGRKYCRRAVELDPNNPVAAMYLGYSYEQSGNYDLAIEQYQRAAGNFHNLSAAGIAHAQALAGRRDEALKIARQIELSKSSDPVDTYNLATIDVALGDNAAALQQLEKTKLSPLIVSFLKYDLQLDPLRSDPRFANFLHTHGLDQRFERAGE